MSKSKGTTTPDVAKAALGPVDLAKMRRPPTHPGEIFRHEFRLAATPPLEQAEAAGRLGWSRNRMNEFERGKRGVTPENAVLLGLLTRTSPEFWMTLQARHDLWHAIRKVGKQAVKAIA